MDKDQYVAGRDEVAAVNQVRQKYITTYAPMIPGWAQLSPDSVLVDVPCGTGEMVKTFRSQGLCRFVYLVDINPAMTSAAREAVPENASYITADAADLGSHVPDGVDVIICLNGFHIYIDRKAAFLRACKETLRPGGRMVVDVSSMGFEAASRRYLLRHDELMRAAARDLGTEALLPPHPDEDLIGSYEDMFRTHGFRVADMHLDEATIMISQFNDATAAIPGRLRPRFPQLDDQTRLKLFLETSAQAQQDIGQTTVRHSRIFYVLEA